MKVEVVVERSVEMEQPWFDRQVFATLSLILFFVFYDLFKHVRQHSSVPPSNIGRKCPKFTSTYRIVLYRI